MNKLEDAIKWIRNGGKIYYKFGVLILLEHKCYQYGNQKNLAKAIGISPSYLNDVLNHRRDPGKKILDWLRLEKKIVYIDKRVENEET